MTTDQKLLQVGLVGCGWACRDLHLPALSSMSGIQVAALADTDPQCVESIAKLAGAPPRRYATAAELAAQPGIDIVAVTVPTRWHAEAGCAALAAGKHVLIEKPLALTLEECDALSSQAAASERKAMVGFNLRWNPNVRKARELIRHGELGRIDMVRSLQTGYHMQIPPWRTKRETGGGVLWEIAPHHIDLWRYLLGTEVEEIFAATESDDWDDVAASLTGRMANGTLVSACFGQRTISTNELEIYGRKGRLVVSCYQFDGLRWEAAESVPGAPGARLQAAASMIRRLPEAFSFARRGGIHKTTFRSEWEHFTAAIRNNTEVESSLEDGRRATEVILAALHSASTGQPVRLPLG